MNLSSQISDTEIREGLSRILESDEFRTSPRLQEILRHIVEKTVAGRAGEINETTVAVEVFHRKAEDLDGSDSVVRVSMARLRRKLSHYYQSQGKEDSVLIEVGAGSYTPSFSRRQPENIPVEVIQSLPQPLSQPKQARKRPASMAVLLILVVITGAALGGFFAQYYWTGLNEQIQTVPVIAVMSEEADTGVAGLGASFQAALTSSLSRLPEVRVMARGFGNDNKLQSLSIDEIRSRYGVTHLIRGSYSRQNDNLRLDIDLVDTATQQTLWAERFEDRSGNVFDFEKRTIIRVSTALSIVMDPDETQMLYLNYTDSREAISLFTKAMYTIFPPHEVGRIHVATDLFRKVTHIDPGFGGGYAGLSLTHSYLVFYGHSDDPEHELSLAREQADKAIEVDPAFALGHSALGVIYTVKGNHQDALTETRRAVALEPKDPSAHLYLAVSLMFSGNNTEALNAINDAIRLDPIKVRTPYLNIRSGILYNLGRYQEAIESFEDNLARGGPDAPTSTLVRALTYAKTGQIETARAIVAGVNAMAVKFDVKRWLGIWAGPAGKADDAIKTLRELGLKSLKIDTPES
jgi:tetratricopeptide (TPR) repeat protein/Holliday junction resolvase-like predicted endonuclease